METYYIVWWEYFNYKAGQYDEDGANGYAVDHYEPFQTLKEAKEALPHYLKLDSDAHII